MTTPVPLQVPVSSMIEAAGGWLPVFVPVMVIGLALTVLVALGALLLYFIRRGAR